MKNMHEYKVIKNKDEMVWKYTVFLVSTLKFQDIDQTYIPKSCTFSSSLKFPHNNAKF